MRQQAAVNHARYNGNGLSKKLFKVKKSLANTAKRVRGKTSRMLSKSMRDVKLKTNHLSHDIDKAVVKNRYQTIGAALLTGLCLGYFLKK